MSDPSTAPDPQQSTAPPDEDEQSSATASKPDDDTEGHRFVGSDRGLKHDIRPLG